MSSAMRYVDDPLCKIDVPKKALPYIRAVLRRQITLLRDQCMVRELGAEQTERLREQYWLLSRVLELMPAVQTQE